MKIGCEGNISGFARTQDRNFELVKVSKVVHFIAQKMLTLNINPKGVTSEYDRYITQSYYIYKPNVIITLS